MIVEGVEVRDIPGFPDYAITEDGRVWSKPRRYGHRNGLRKGKWLKYWDTGDGHLQVALYASDGRKKFNYVHYLVLITYEGPRPEGLICRHLDGNPANNHFSNLKWGTESENVYDSIRHGTRVDTRGEGCGRAKLTALKVKALRYLYSLNFFTHSALAWQFDITSANVSSICSGKTWKSI